MSCDNVAHYCLKHEQLHKCKLFHILFLNCWQNIQAQHPVSSTLLLHSKHSQRETKAPTSWAQQPGSVHTVPASCAGPALRGLSDGYKSPRITWHRESGSWRTVMTLWADVARDPINRGGSLSILGTIKPFGET